jgi:hypothetical protein
MTNTVDAIFRIPRARHVMLYLGEHPGSFRGDIQKALGIPGSSLGRLLAALHVTGAIFGDQLVTASKTRGGYAIRYTADLDLVRSAIDELPGLRLRSSAPERPAAVHGGTGMVGSPCAKKDASFQN